MNNSPKMGQYVNVNFFIKNDPTNWSAEAIKHRKPGVFGKIINYSNSHGLCFQIDYKEDVGWYDEHELKF